MMWEEDGVVQGVMSRSVSSRFLPWRKLGVRAVDRDVIII